ncbi:MAG: sulfatase-like hydrolase/transferase [Saprospiraceae bacterium]|nr:sulfatase-like hydrolase/transferase [Saprospiraceae bacterium]
MKLDKIKNELVPLKNAMKLMALMLCIFTGLKILFFIVNESVIPHPKLHDLPIIILQSLRFDTATLLYVNALFLFLILIPLPVRGNKYYQNLLKIIYIVPNLISIVFEMIDIGFFPFSQRRFILSDFEMMMNNAAMIPTYVLENWYLLIIFIALYFLMSSLYNKFFSKNFANTSAIIQILIFLFSTTIIIIGMRGGLQLRPIVPATAAEFVPESRQMPLIASTSMNLIFSTQQRLLTLPNNYDPTSACSIHQVCHVTNPAYKTKDNIVIIILESFGKEAVGYFNDYECNTPFLDSLLNQSYVPKHTFANGLRSTQGITAIASGLPSIMEDPLMFSAYQSNNIEGIGSYLSEVGYQSFFFHGANKGSMEFERFAKMAGFNHYYDIDEYPNSKDYDGSWGIWDYPYFQYIKNNIDTVTTPFCAMFFSLTSHHPYKTEDWFEKKYPNLTPFNRAMRYTDNALRNFFSEAKKSKWYDNTLFIILADHSGLSTHSEYQNAYSRYEIPIAFFHPKRKMSSPNEIVQQIDLLPTVLDIVGYPKPYFSFGKSIFDTTPGRYVINYSDGIHQLLSYPYLIQKSQNDIHGVFNVEVDPLLKSNLTTQMPAISSNLYKELNTIINQYNYAMIHNKLNFESQSAICK